MDSGERKKYWKKGQAAEWIAAMFLMVRGYRILARQYKCPVGEIDIIARRRDTVVFVEVKTRNSDAEARHAISERQKNRIINSSRAYLQKHPGFSTLTQRFDAVLVIPWRWPRHLKNAWISQ